MEVIFLNAEKALGFGTYRGTLEVFCLKPTDKSERKLIEWKCLVDSTSTYRKKV